MKIALVYHRFHPNTGGVETYMRKLAEQYAAEGHKTAVFTSEPYYKESTRGEKSLRAQRPKTQVPWPATPADGANTGYKVFYIKPRKFLGYPVPSKKALTLLKAFNPDIIHVNSPHPYSTAFAMQARKTSRKTRVPVIATYHGHANPTSRLKRAAARLERRLYGLLFKHMIVTSDFYKNQAAAFYPAKKITSIPLGIDPVFLACTVTPREARDLLDISHRRKIVLFVGAMDASHYYKGIPELLACAAKTPAVEYMLVGGGADRAKYENLSAGLSNVTFCGPADAENLPLYYKAADCLVLPSTSNSEGFGLVLLEAMASGTPIITTDVVGSAELIRSKNAGLIIAPKNPESLEKGIIRLLGEHDLHRTLVANGLVLAKNLTWTATARQTLKVYEIAKSSHQTIKKRAP